MMNLKLPASSHLASLQYIFFISLILYAGQTLFIPLSFALLISCILYPVCAWLEKHKVGRMSAILICIAGITLIFTLLIFLLINQLFGFFKEWPLIEARLITSMESVSLWLTQTFDVPKGKQVEWLNQVFNLSGSVMAFVKEAVAVSAVGAVLFILIPIYSILILYYRSKWMDVLYRLFPQEGRDRIREIVKLSIESYYNFIKGMALVYLIVGILNSLGLWLLGIPHPFLFGFTSSILTFIPYVGIIVASLLPISISWITYNSIWYPLGVIGIFVFVQYLEANVIFPLAVSSKLKINALVTLVAIIGGGLLWGVAGMILFIPFLGILKLVADRSPGLKTLAITLGD